MTELARIDGALDEALDGRSRWFFWGALVAILVAFGAVRWRLLDAPLERDEGEYAVFAQFILDGVPPYAEAVNMKLPGIYMVYTGILALFGESARSIHLGLLVANLLGGGLAALLARKVLRSGAAGLVAGASFLAFTLGPHLQGPWANAEAFLLPILLLAGCLFVHALQAPGRLGWLLACGLALGCGVLVKQHAALFCLAVGLILVGWHIQRERRLGLGLIKDASALIAATLTPYLLTIAVLTALGVFDRFWFWTWDYARAYTGQFGLGDMGANLVRSGRTTLLGTWPLLSVAVLGSLGLWARSKRRGLAAAFLVLGCFSFAAISVGFIYRPHYFQLLAPFVALGCGAFVALPSATGLRVTSVVIAVLGVLYVPYEERTGLFELTPAQLTATVYPGNGFDGMPEVGEYLAELVPEGERFAVIGSEPELYFYANRRPATAYVYTYALMELQPYAMQMHGEMADEIERAEPEILVVVYTPTSWLQRPESETFIQTWASSYLASRFELIGTLLNGRGKRVLVRKDKIANVHAPKPAVILEIYQRKSR